MRAQVGDHPAFRGCAVAGFPAGDAVDREAVEERGFSGCRRQFDAAAGGEDLAAGLLVGFGEVDLAPAFPWMRVERPEER